MFLRKRSEPDPLWKFAAQPPHADVPAALRELVRDGQVVVDRAEAAGALDYLRAVGFRDDEMPVELVDGDGRPVSI